MAGNALNNSLETQSTQVTITGAVARPVALPETNTPPRASNSGVTVQALPGNTQIVYIGMTGITSSTGFPLAPGAQMYLGIADPSRFYALAASGSQTLALIWVGAPV